MVKYHRSCAATVVLTPLPKRETFAFCESLCVYHLVRDSSILWHRVPPTPRATPRQDLSVGLQGPCMGLAAGTRAGPSLDASA